MSNDFLPFCPTDTGTNLLNNSDYAAASDRTDGNQPGVASSKLNNKALRQSSFVISQLAQFAADQTGVSVTDDNPETPAKFLAQLNAAIRSLPPTITKYTSGSGTHNVTYYFFISSGNATAGATYTNNTVTFTVVTTVASGTLVKMTGNGDPTASGTLTKASGTGDATLAFYAFRKPVLIEVIAVGPGGGSSTSGTGSNTSGSNGSADTTFGTSLITAGKGSGGSQQAQGGAGGTATATGLTAILVPGENGQGSGNNGSSGTGLMGADGGSTPLAGGGKGGAGNSVGFAASANTGGGGGAPGSTSGASSYTGAAGGAGGYVRAWITSPASTYPYAIGAGGAGGSPAGTAGAGTAHVGTPGSDGLIMVFESYQ